MNNTGLLELAIVIYLLEYRLSNGFVAKAFIKPIDLQNGVIMDEISPDSGMMQAASYTGRMIRVALDHIVSLTEWKVSTRPGFFGTGTRTTYKTDKQVERLLDNLPRNPETGEVQGISSIEPVTPENDRRKKKP